MTLGTVGINVSAYGGTQTFNVNGVYVTKSIDAYRSSPGAYTECTPLSCSFVYVSLRCENSSTGSKESSDYATRGSISVNLSADSCKSFCKAES